MEEERTIRFTRMFDDGGPFVVETPGSGDIEPSRIAIATRLCDSPDCPCRDMTLAVRRLESLGDGRARIVESSEVRAKFNVDTSELSACEVPGGIERSQELVELLRGALDSDHLAFLRARWQRTKAQRTDEWQKLDFSTIDIDAMVPYLQLVPSDWDLCVDQGSHRYWFIDYWCMKPGCPCKEFKIEVLRADGGTIGMVEAETSKWQGKKSKSESVALSLWQNGIRDPLVRKTLEERRRKVRVLAERLRRECDLELAAPTTTPLAGRNEPCPCGSGKKYKKCCLATAPEANNACLATR